MVGTTAKGVPVWLEPQLNEFLYGWYHSYRSSLVRTRATEVPWLVPELQKFPGWNQSYRSSLVGTSGRGGARRGRHITAGCKLPKGARPHQAVPVELSAVRCRRISEAPNLTRGRGDIGRVRAAATSLVL